MQAGRVRRGLGGPWRREFRAGANDREGQFRQGEGGHARAHRPEGPPRRMGTVATFGDTVVVVFAADTQVFTFLITRLFRKITATDHDIVMFCAHTLTTTDRLKKVVLSSSWVVNVCWVVDIWKVTSVSRSQFSAVPAAPVGSWFFAFFSLRQDRHKDS